MTIKETVPPKEMPTWAVGTDAAIRVGNYADIIAEFRLAMRAAGINYSDEIVADGRLHRFHIPGHTPGTLNGAYTLHMDGRPAGFFQSFCDPVSKQTWKFEGKTSSQNKVHPSMLRMSRQKRVDEQERRHNEAQLRAMLMWSQSKPAPSNHPYLVRKDVKPHGIRVLNNDLVIPVLDKDIIINSLQFISSDGTKRFLSGGRKKGCFYFLGDKFDHKRLIICEGFATGASLHEYTGQRVIIAFDAGNLGLVAKVIRARFPGVQIVIAGDNDESGVGQSAAQAAAEAVSGETMIPRLAGDWNEFKSSIRGAM